MEDTSPRYHRWITNVKEEEERGLGIESEKEERRRRIAPSVAQSVLANMEFFFFSALDLNHYFFWVIYNRVTAYLGF